MKKFIRIFVFVVSFFVFLYLIFNSVVGKKFLLAYLEDKLSFISEFEIKKFDYNFNDFSLILKKGSNDIFLRGKFYPLKAFYRANLKNLEEINSNFRGNLKANGILKYKNFLQVKGKAFGCGGRMKYVFDKINSLKGEVKAKNLDFQKLMYMLKTNAPYFKGKIDVDLFYKDVFLSNFRYLGEVNLGKVIFYNVKADGEAKIKNKNDFKTTFNLESKDLSGNISFDRLKKSFNLKGNVKVNLEKLRPFVFYPLEGFERFNISFSNNKPFEFYNAYLNGVFYNQAVDVDINSLPSKKFFEIVGITPFFDSLISGEVGFGRGKLKFSFVSNDLKIINSGVLRKILNYLKLKNLLVDTFLVKGVGNKKYLKFNLMGSSKKDGLYFSIQNGILKYNGKYFFKLEIFKRKIKYLFSVRNGEVKLIYKTKMNKNNNEILVF